MTKIQKLFIALSFVAGIIFFFPIASLETRLSEVLSKTIRGDVRVMAPRLGFGFKTGLMSGGLFALRAEQIEITMPSSPQTFVCQNVVLSPKFLALLILRLQAAVYCELGAQKNPILAVAKSSLLSPSDMSFDLELENLPIKEVAGLMKISNLSGLISGEASVSGLALGLQGIQASWNLSINELKTPPVNSDYVSLPPLSFGVGQIEGSMESNKVNINTLKMGTENKDPLVTDLQIELGFNENGSLTTGYIQGSLKSSEDFDQAISSVVNMDKIFGIPKMNGFRRFRKPIQGNLISLLGAPEELP